MIRLILFVLLWGMVGYVAPPLVSAPDTVKVIAGFALVVFAILVSYYPLRKGFDS